MEEGGGACSGAMAGAGIVAGEGVDEWTGAGSGTGSRSGASLGTGGAGVFLLALIVGGRGAVIASRAALGG